MALNDNATLVIGSGNYLKAPTDTPLPADLRNPADPWERVGHTALDEILNMSSEGGEVTVLGTLQNKQLRTRRSPKTDIWTFTLQQFDTGALRLYYGSNAPTLADGSIGVPSDPIPTTCAFAAIFLDGDNVFAFYAPKVEIIGGESPEFADTESLAGMPITVRPLISGENDWAFAVTPLGEVAEPVA